MKKNVLISAMFSVMFLAFYSCSEKVNSEANIKDIEKDARAIFTKPDSLKTPKEKELLSKLIDVGYEYSDIVDNKFVMKISRDEFINMGLPGIYYDIIEKDFSDLNNCLDTISTRLLIINEYKDTRKKYFESKITIDRAK